MLQAHSGFSSQVTGACALEPPHLPAVPSAHATALTSCKQDERHGSSDAQPLADVSAYPLHNTLARRMQLCGVRDQTGLRAGKLIGDLGSATWKHRNAAVEAVETILASAGGRITPATGGLLPALKVLD